MGPLFRRIIARLPYDAWCCGPVADPLERAVRARINSFGAARFPRVVRLPALGVLRVAWLVWCAYRVRVVVRKLLSQNMAEGYWHTLLRCYRQGSLPMEVLAPDLMVGSMAALDIGRLADSHWLKLWRALGHPHSLRLAQDKRAFAQRLAGMGIPVPTQLAEIPQGTSARLWDVLEQLPWSVYGTLFFKPRHGSRAQGAMSVQRLAHDSWRVNGHATLSAAGLSAQLCTTLLHDAVLVQPFLRPLAATADLSNDAPLELRITTAHYPDGRAVVQGACLKIQKPGSHASTIQTGALAVPVHPGRGDMDFGLLRSQPTLRLQQVPWNGAPIAGRSLPHYMDAEAMVLEASRALPGVPVVGWDVLLTAEGPVILEANTGLSWHLMHLGQAVWGQDSCLPEIVREWLCRPASGL